MDTSEIPPSVLAENLAFRLEQLGMSRRELGRRTGLSRQTIHHIEHEGGTNLKPSTFRALDESLRWNPGTAMALAMGQLPPQHAGDAVQEYMGRIAMALSSMTDEELHLTLVMMEENHLGQPTTSTTDFLTQVGKVVGSAISEIRSMQSEKPIQGT